MSVANPSVKVRNLSTAISDTEVQNICKALQLQAAGALKRYWGVNATVTFEPDSYVYTPTDWALEFQDDAPSAGELGVHDLRTGFDKPIGYVYVKTAQKYNASVSVVASHEFLELMVDPYINLNSGPTKHNTTYYLYGYEVADPVEDDTYGYEQKIDSTGTQVLLSNFVTPEWFIPGSDGPWDAMQRLKAPLTVGTHGYYSYLDLSTWKTTGWQQVFGDKVPEYIRSQHRHDARASLLQES